MAASQPLSEKLLVLVESLSEEQQDDLMDFLTRLRIARRREEMDKNIDEGMAEYHRGEARTGSIEVIMHELMVN